MTDDITIGALVLAAGASNRFGGVKALAPWGDTHLIGQALATAQMFAPRGVMTVLGAGAENIQAALGDADFVVNENWRDGMGGSLACGLRALQQRHPMLEALAILLVDQPLVSVDHLQALTRTAMTEQRCILTSDGSNAGPPAGVPKALFASLAGLTGEHGLKSILMPDMIGTILNVVALADADTPETLDQLSATRRDR